VSARFRASGGSAGDERQLTTSTPALQSRLTRCELRRHRETHPHLQSGRGFCESQSDRGSVGLPPCPMTICRSRSSPSPGRCAISFVAAILAGEKTATTGLVADYEQGNESLPSPGLREVVVDSAGRPVAVIETTAVRVMRPADVDLNHALGEGEEYASVVEWRAGHEQFWPSAEMRQALGDPHVHGRRRHPRGRAGIPAHTRLKPGTPVKMLARSCRRERDEMSGNQCHCNAGHRGGCVLRDGIPG